MRQPPRPHTSLQQVRTFLVQQDAAPPAWSPGAATVQALYDLLQERRDDPSFWGALEGLLERIEDARLRPDLIAGAETLDGATVGELLTALRQSLPKRGPASAGVGVWASGLRGRALAAFLLLGTAVGCPTAGPGDECSEADGLGLENMDADVFCDLVEIVQGSSASQATQDELLDCLRGLTTSRRETLLATFLDLSGDALADALEDLALSEECSDVGDDDDDDDDH